MQAILFDIDGTLSDSDDKLARRFQKILRPLDFLVRSQPSSRIARWLVMFSESPGNKILEIADRLHLDGILARFLDRRATAKNAQRSALDYPIIPGVDAMLAAVGERYPLAVVSARNEVTTRYFLHVNGLERYFRVVVTSQTCARTKPFPDPLHFAAQFLGVPVEACLMVGDTVTDVRAALAAGAQSLSVLCGFGAEKELRESGTQAVLPCTADLAEFLGVSPGT